MNREKIVDKRGPDMRSDWYVNMPWQDWPPTPTRPSLEKQIDRDIDEENPPLHPPVSSVAREETGVAFQNLASAPEAEADARMVIGSDNWVVSGAHTISGKPLLSNDMHLGHQMPNLWYEAHLRSGGYDVVGVTLPGMPFVVVGHNQRIAWGFTNVEPTVQDLYVEAFNAAGQYQTPQWVS